METTRHTIRNILSLALTYSFFILCVLVLLQQSRLSDWHDFDVFYHAASAALKGNSPYIIVGQYNLPFWYPPWIAWFFIPFAFFPKDIGLFIYQLASILCAISIVHYLTSYYQRDFKVQNKIIILSFLVLLSLQLIAVGQMEYIFLFLLVAIIWATEHNKDVLVGILYPFLLTKPHLIIPFSIYLFLRTGKRALSISVLLSIGMLLLETILHPKWYFEMYSLFQNAGTRTDGLKFTTFPSLLGFQENWLGTANIPITIGLIFLALLLLWKYRTLSTMPFLSVALVASLFCAPRAYAYDLPLLIPALIWLTKDKFSSQWWLWMIVSIFPIIVSFSSYTYLVVLFVFGLCIYKLEQERRSEKRPRFENA